MGGQLFAQPGRLTRSAMNTGRRNVREETTAEAMQCKQALRTRNSKISLRAEVAAFTSTLVLQSVTFNLFILLTFLVLHSPTQHVQSPQPTLEATSPLPPAAPLDLPSPRLSEDSWETGHGRVGPTDADTRMERTAES